MAVVRHKAAILSGHYMVSDFEPDEQDEEDANVAEEEGSGEAKIYAEPAVQEQPLVMAQKTHMLAKKPNKIRFLLSESKDTEISLPTLFKSMSIAYRQRLTSPRWNRFRGLKLRWKDKIRMNNVIWRCWHMQFMKNDPRTLCAFANPLEIDNHNRTEGTTLLEGKYWKRKLETIQTEYNHWRRFYHINHECGDRSNHSQPCHHDSDMMVTDLENILKSPAFTMVEGSRDDVDLQSMLNDEGMIVDLLLNTFSEASSSSSGINALFSTASMGQFSSSTMSVAVPFPNPRDYYKTTTNADLLQPGLGSLQPNLEDMEFDLDWLESNNTNNSSYTLKNEAKPLDLLSAVVTATTATPVLSHQPQFELPTRTSPMIVTTTPSQPTIAQPQMMPHYGGGKQRPIFHHELPNPYQSQLKLRSPKHRLLQHRDTFEAYQPPIMIPEAKNSELVQLLKTPKAEQRPVYFGIPPPLATDFQQNNATMRRPSYRGLTNTPQYAEHRRSIHISAEQNRRTSIKHGFEELRSLIPSLKDVPASSHKISKAALLHKGGDYIRQMKSEMISMEQETSNLRVAIEKLELDVSSLQGYLPASGGGSGKKSSICGKLRQRKVQEDSDVMRELFNMHVRNGTEINWKFWAFSRLMKPFFDTFSDSVAGTASFSELERSTNHWMEDKCSLIQIRQWAMTSLKTISVTTNILNDPHLMPQEALDLAENPNDSLEQET